MAVTIAWDAPTLDSTKTYTFTVYRSTSGEDAVPGDGTYVSIASSQSAKNSSGANVLTYSDSTGDKGFYYYVTYTASGEAEGDPLVAIVKPSIKEIRLVRDFKEELPPLMQKGLDSHDRKILSALQYALKALNAMSPVTSYSLSTMPPQYEPATRLGALIFFYSTQYLKIAIRDFNYGVGGLSLNIDRGSKIHLALQDALQIYNEFAKSVKMIDYPDPLGYGSYAIALPQQRVLGFLFNSSAGI